MKAAACLEGLGMFTELCSLRTGLIWAECSMLELEWKMVLENGTDNHQMLSGKQSYFQKPPKGTCKTVIEETIKYIYNTLF